MAELVLTEQRGKFFEIVLNRPDKRNAVNPEMIGQFERAVRAANRAPDVRCVFLRGEASSKLRPGCNKPLKSWKKALSKSLAAPAMGPKATRANRMTVFEFFGAG